MERLTDDELLGGVKPPPQPLPFRVSPPQGSRKNKNDGDSKGVAEAAGVDGRPGGRRQRGAAGSGEEGALHGSRNNKNHGADGAWGAKERAREARRVTLVGVVCICMCVCIDIYMYARVCVCIYIHI